MRRLTVLLMAVALFAMGAVAPAIAKDDKGKKLAEGAFHSIGTGGAVLTFGAAAAVNPQASDDWDGVRIFGYEDGPSEGRVYCGDVWNVIVTVGFAPFPSMFDDVFATHAIDAGDPAVAEMQTPVRWSPTLDFFTQGNGTLIPPGTLSDGPHTVTQTVEHPIYGVFWAPNPVSFEVDDSAC